MKRYFAYSALMWLMYLMSTALIALVLLPPAGLRTLVASVAPYFSVTTPLGPAYAGSFSNVFSTITHSIVNSDTLRLGASFIFWVVLTLPSIVLGILFLIQRQKLKAATSDHVVDVMKNKLYRDTDISKEFGNFLDTYFKGSELNLILNNHESADQFTVIKTFKGGSNALTLLAWQNERMVVKKITLPQYAEKLSSQYQWLSERSHLKRVAQIVGEYEAPDHYAIDIEYRDEFIPFFDFIHASAPIESWRVLKRLCTFNNNRIYKVEPITDQHERLMAYIDEKVINKVIDASHTNLSISRLLNFKTIVVNGRELDNFHRVVQKIKNNKRAMKDLKVFGESPIHGDLTIDNVIVNPATLDYLLLDPNNENAISDPVTDYGKLFQSLHSGYEFLVLMNQVQVTKDRMSFEEKKSVQYDYLYTKLNAYLENVLSPEQYRSVLFHEAVHYCRMLTYRVNINPETAPAFYGIAVRLFNDFLAQYSVNKDGKS